MQLFRRYAKLGGKKKLFGGKSNYIVFITIVFRRGEKIFSNEYIKNGLKSWYFVTIW